MTGDKWIESLADALVGIAHEIAEGESEDDQVQTFTKHVPVVAAMGTRPATVCEARPTTGCEFELNRGRPEPRPVERVLAEWWGALERGEGRPATVEMERRIACASGGEGRSCSAPERSGVGCRYGAAPELLTDDARPPRCSLRSSATRLSPRYGRHNDDPSPRPTVQSIWVSAPCGPNRACEGAGQHWRHCHRATRLPAMAGKG